MSVISKTLAKRIALIAGVCLAFHTFLATCEALPTCNGTKPKSPASGAKCGEGSDCAEPDAGEPAETACTGDSVVQQDDTAPYCSADGATSSQHCEVSTDDAKRVVCTKTLYCKTKVLTNPIGLTCVADGDNPVLDGDDEPVVSYKYPGESKSCSEPG